MRTADQLNDAELRQYVSLMERKADQTLSKADHDAAQEEIDRLLWKDADGRLRSIEARLDRIEAGLGMGKFAIAPPTPTSPPAGATQALAIGTRVEDIPPGTTQAEVQKQVGEEIRQRMSLKSSAGVVSVKDAATGKELYVVMNLGIDKWVVKHSDPGMRDFGPYDSPEAAQLVADRLNSGPDAIPVSEATPAPPAAPTNPPEVVATSPTEVHARPAAESEDGRGRPKNRFVVGGKRGNWFVEDTTGAIPAEKFPAWKLKKDCANSAKGLNNHPNPDALFMGPPPAAQAAPAQPQAENAPINNWDPDPIPVTPQPSAAGQLAPGYQEPLGPTEAAQAAGVAPDVIPATGHTNAPVAAGGVLGPGGDADNPEGVVIHKPSMADAGIHVMANEAGEVVRVDPMGLGDMDG